MAPAPATMTFNKKNFNKDGNISTVVILIIPFTFSTILNHSFKSSSGFIIGSGHGQGPDPEP
jgi:hypothetical protein